MSRPLRIEFPRRRASHHVTARGHQREPTFESDDDRALLLGIVGQTMKRCDAVMLAYLLLDGQSRSLRAGHAPSESFRPNAAVERHLNPGLQSTAWQGEACMCSRADSRRIWWAETESCWRSVARLSSTPRSLRAGTSPSPYTTPTPPHAACPWRI